MTNKKTKPTVYMLAGLPGSGKTTFAKKMEAEGAVRLTVDEEVFKRFGKAFDSKSLTQYEKEIKNKFKKTLRKELTKDKSVVLDYGFWKKDERDLYKELASALGAEWKLLYFKIDVDELKSRISKRNTADSDFNHVISEELLETFVKEFEPPIDEGEILKNDSLHNMRTKSDKVIFFDCYQTLLDVQLDGAKMDEQHGWEEFVNLLAKNHRIKISAGEFVALLEKRKADFYSDKDKTTQHHNLCTLVSDVLEKDLQTPLPKDEILRLIYEYRKISRGYVRLYPKVADTLVALADEYTLVIASYTQSCFTQLELRELGIEKYFSYFVYSPDIVFKKESPEFYRECLRLVQKKPKDCIMVGDNYREDIAIPTSLGMSAIWINNPATVSKNPEALVEVKNTLDLADFDKLQQVVGQVFEN